MKYLMLVLLLAGCCSKEALVVTKYVDKPIPVLCVKQNELPEREFLAVEALSPDANEFDKVQAITVDRLVLLKENNILWAILHKCVDAQSEP